MIFQKIIFQKIPFQKISFPKNDFPKNYIPKKSVPKKSVPKKYFPKKNSPPFRRLNKSTFLMIIESICCFHRKCHELYLWFFRIQSLSYLAIKHLYSGVTKGWGHLSRAPRFGGRQIEKKIYTRYSEAVFTTKKKTSRRKISKFLSFGGKFLVLPRAPKTLVTPLHLYIE